MIINKEKEEGLIIWDVEGRNDDDNLDLEVRKIESEYLNRYCCDQVGPYMFRLSPFKDHSPSFSFGL